MKTQSASSIHFQRKISDFCNLRIAPLVPKRSLENITPYLLSLIIYRKAPPTRSGRIDWSSLGAACGLEHKLSGELKTQIKVALEAIERWIENERSSDDDHPRPDYEDTDEARVSSRAGSNRKTPLGVPPEMLATARAKPGVPPKPVEEFPQPLFAATENPADFAAALIYHMRRHGDTYWHLFRALEGMHPKLESSTVVSWIKGHQGTTGSSNAR